MKKRYVNVCVLFGVVLVLVLGGCPTDGGGGGSGGPYTPPTNSGADPDTEDFGAGAKVNQTFTVDAINLSSTLNAIISGGNNKNYVINVMGTIDFSQRPSSGSGFPNNLKLSFRGTGTLTNFHLELDSGTLILRGPTLRGDSSDDDGVVEIKGGTFVLRSGTIDANGNKYGVYMKSYNGNRFEMHGGKITKAGDDGVNMHRGTFTMTGGEITGNGRNGVALIETGATFNLNPPATKASIYGNKAYQVLKNSGTFKVNGVNADTYNGSEGTGPSPSNSLVDIEDFGPGSQVDNTFTVASVNTLRQINEAIHSGGDNKNYVINVTGDIEFPGTIIPSENSKVSIRGTGTITGVNGRVVDTGPNSTIILRGPTLKGNRNAEVCIVEASSTFVMRSGTIDANGNKYGVYSQSNINSRFEMYGGEIKNAHLDGVHIEFGQPFTMTGGKITGNARYGVFVGNQWIIFNLNPPATKANIYGNTQAQVYVEPGGTFNVDGSPTSSY